ncbi:MAG: hypothetical protein ACREJV_10180 [Candidatus Rokuibacteriota bacterium]
MALFESGADFSNGASAARSRRVLPPARYVATTADWWIACTGSSIAPALPGAAEACRV